MGVTVRNLGWNEIKRSIIDLDDVYTKVGFPHEKTEKHKDSDTTMQTIAVVHEFGSPKMHVPARPYMRPAFDNNVKDLETMQLSAYHNVVDGKNPLKAIGRVGAFMKLKIQRAITDVKYPLLKSRGKTKYKKIDGVRTAIMFTSGNPLVDSGDFRKSVTHVEVIR